MFLPPSVTSRSPISELAARPPSRSAASTIVTCQPASRRYQAAATPEAPPPTTIAVRRSPGRTGPARLAPVAVMRESRRAAPTRQACASCGRPLACGAGPVRLEEAERVRAAELAPHDLAVAVAQRIREHVQPARVLESRQWGDEAPAVAPHRDAVE